MVSLFEIRLDERAFAELIPSLQADKWPELAVLHRLDAQLDHPGQVGWSADGYRASRSAAAPVLIAGDAQQVVIAKGRGQQIPHFLVARDYCRQVILVDIGALYLVLVRLLALVAAISKGVVISTSSRPKG